MIRLALVGCKEAEAYAEIAPRLCGGAFVAVVDDNTDRVRLAADPLSVDFCFPSLEELLQQQSDKIDAVVVHLLPAEQPDTCRQAAQAGKHVLATSPLAETVSDADTIIGVCKQAGVRLMVGQASRFLPAVREVKACLAAGKLGELGLLRIHDWQSSAVGATTDQRVIEQIDLAIWMAGQLPSEVFSCGGGDYRQIHLGFPDRAMALIDVASNLPAGDDYYSLSAIGANGAAYADDHRNVQLLYGGGSPAALKTGQGRLHKLAMLQEFVDAIDEERYPAIGGDDGRTALLVAEAARLSAERGCAVHLQGGGYELA